MSKRSEKRARKQDAMVLVGKAQEILRQWDPIGIDPCTFGPNDEYDAYAHHIVSMVVQGASVDEVSRHLESLRLNAMGLSPSPSLDRRFAEKLVASIGRVTG